MRSEHPEYDCEAGFTLMEALVVLMIIAILMAASFSGLQHARRLAWKTRARDSARQLTGAWNLYLLDNREFPKRSDFGDAAEGGYLATAANLRVLNKNKVYLELSEDEEKREGMRDDWRGKSSYNRLLRFNLDFDYKGEIENPAPEAFGGRIHKIKANAIAWSTGHKPENRKSWIVQW